MTTVSAEKPGAQQLLQRVVHLEADVALLARRKAELELENEALAAAASRQSDLEASLAKAIADRDRLEAGCRRHSAESARRAELEAQQQNIARAFAELQGVVAQLVQRVVVLDAQRTKLSKEKNAAESIAAALRAELQEYRAFWGLATGPGPPNRSSGSFRHGRGGYRLRCRAEAHPWATTPPRRHATAVQQRSAVDAASARRSASPGAGDETVELQLAVAKVQCEALRQRLLCEEQACARACEGHAALLRKSSFAESHNNELRTELREVLASWSARGSDEEVLQSSSSAAAVAFSQSMAAIAPHAASGHIASVGYRRVNDGADDAADDAGVHGARVEDVGADDASVEDAGVKDGATAQSGSNSLSDHNVQSAED
mmetsp:Transcript_107641/g.303180  ORF Transcript_107641/g.303180 Transcript_107641/m.303180 type:complete len:375 (-) Transcript_107641:287-1411(-)